jgi:hypothetical protein
LRTRLDRKSISLGGYLNLLLTRPANDGMITLRQTANGRFVKGPAIPALPPA